MSSASAVQQMHNLLKQFDHDQAREILAAFSTMHGIPAANCSKFPTTVAGNARVTKNKATRHKKRMSAESGPPSRPLNSWMAFRSYYSPIFKSVQQKSISGYLKQLWAADESHDKWAIISKAYALLRTELSKEEAPLDTFLDLVAPHAGALSRDEYFAVLGWTFQDHDGDVELRRSFIPRNNMIPATYRSTMVSSDDLVDYIITQNFLSRGSLAKLRRTKIAAVDLTMAVPPARSPAPRLKRSSTTSTSSIFDTSRSVADSAIDDILREALESKHTHHSTMPGPRPDACDTADCRGIAHGGLSKMDHVPISQLFDPFDDLDFPTFDPSSGARDAVFDLGDSSMYNTLSAGSADNSADMRMQLEMQQQLEMHEYLGF